ncbi:MAG: RNA polymerase sporulation sigma factor SigE [Clostridiales bacterium]|nr:RNA polymerase sporulation sigma factor SigE [Clostridiales bacterium]
MLKRIYEKLLCFVGALFQPKTVHYINGSEALPPPLKKEEEETLMNKLITGDESVRQTLIVRNIRLVVYIARKFENTNTGLEDMISIGTIGLIKAVNTFDPTKNIKLATYASRCIENEILMYMRKTSHSRQEISLDEPLNTDLDGNELLLSDILGTESDLIYKEIEEDVERSLLSEAVLKLPQREKEIICMRFGLLGNREFTQKQVADNLGISQSYISRLEKRNSEKLKNDIEKKV